MTAFTTLVTAAAILSGSALAWTDHGDGVTTSGKSGSYPYLYNPDINLSWQVNLYVSTRDDGSIDPTTSNITTGVGLAKVGSIFYTKENFENALTYVQYECTDNIRTSTINTYSTATNGIKIYNMPLTRLVFSDSSPELVTGIIFNSKALGETIQLPVSIEQIGNNYEGAVKSVIEEVDANGKNVFITNVTNHIKKDMQASGTGRSFGTNILNAISDKKFKEYWEIMQEKGTEEAASRLYPNSTEPLVGWIATVTPMFSYLTNYSYFTNTFWFVPDSVYRTTGYSTGIPQVAYSVNKKQMVRLILDGYGASQYNYVTKTMFTDDGVNAEIYKSGISVTSEDANNYAKYGLLRAAYGGPIFENAGKCAYVTDPTRSLLYGLHTSDASTNWTDETIHQKGGITVVDQPLEDTPSIPVYYYITPDPDDPITPPGSATPPTFTPDPPPGTKVTKVVVPDKPLPNTDPKNPPEDFPDDEPEVPPNSDGKTYPITPDNPPYILVECEYVELPVYYHIFTFTNKTGTGYDNVFEFLADNSDISESNASEQIVVRSESLAIPAANATDKYYPTTDALRPSGEVVGALSTSGLSGNATYQNVVSEINTSGRYNSRFASSVIGGFYDPAKKALAGSSYVTYYGATDTKDSTKAIHVKIYQMAESASTLSLGSLDHIKAFDVTQLILIDDNETAHINPFDTYIEEDTNKYNTNKMPAANSTHKKTDGGYMIKYR